MKKIFTLAAFGAFLATGAAAQEQEFSEADLCLLDIIRQSSHDDIENYLQFGGGIESTFQPQAAQTVSQMCEEETGTDVTSATDHLRRAGFGLFVAPAYEF